MGAIGTFIGAVATLIAGWVLPMMFPTIPHWAQVALLATSGVLLLISLVLMYLDARGKNKNKSGISVTMRDGNHISRIGNNYAALCRKHTKRRED